MMSTGDLSQSSAVCTSYSQLSRKLTWREYDGLAGPLAFFARLVVVHELAHDEEKAGKGKEGEDGPGAGGHLRQLFILRVCACVRVR